MNDADSQEIARRASAAGYDLVDRPENASVLVLNTCTVRDNAERRAYGRINQWKAVKTADPAVRVIVTGCLAEQDKDRMTRLAPHVDGVFGTKELNRVGDALAAWRDDFADDADDLSADARALLAPMGGVGEGIAGAYDALRAFVNVQRGCSYYCTYCIVPHVRGRFDHRPIGEILAEVRTKVAAGAREIMLVGQTVNAYKEPATGADFADLMETVAALPGVERITFVTSHPKDLTEKFSRVMARIPNVNPRFHLPFQSASNPVLRKMNRKYTIEQYREKLATFDAYNPNWAITTDIIVGFPGETDDDFARTLAYVEERGFAQSYMFVYSPRRGTPAALWEQVPAEVGHERLTRLAAVQDAACTAYHERKVGTVVRALIHGPSRKDPSRITAKTLDNVTVNFPSIEEAPNPAEPWVDVLVESAHVWGVRGTPLRRAAAFADAGHAVTPLPQVLDLIALV
jgi:tRNA-2-methylthio-N6-dimethylallyladenosine synthase